MLEATAVPIFLFGCIWCRVRPTLGTQRSQNKTAVVLCRGRAAAFCLAQRCYVLVQQLSGICSVYTESWAHRGSVSDASLSSVLDEQFLHASIFDVFALVGSVQRIGDRCAGHWLQQIEIWCLFHRSQVHEHLSSMPTAALTNVRRH